jgi:aminopeptidase N
MKTKITLISIISIICISISNAQKQNHLCADSKINKLNLKTNTLTIQQIEKTEKYDVTFYKLNLNMTNLATTLSGIVEIHGKAKLTLDSVLIELFQTFNINEIKLNDVVVNYNRNQSAITIPVNLLQNQAFKLSIDYSGTPPNAATNPLGGSGMTNASSPSWGNRVTWSLSEPFSAFEWFPCKQSLTDKADSVAVSITVPDNCKAGSNGHLIGTSIPELGKKTYHWLHKHPIAYYLISVAVAEYVDYSIYANPIGSNPILIQNFIYNNPATLPNFQTRIDETIDFMELFSDIFGLYPFHDEKYGHCMAPLSGGMEHQTMTTQGFFEKSLTAHELAHQWWGNQVTCQSWADIWVNEGFASYAEYLMLENLYPNEKAQDMLERHSTIMSQNGGSVYVIDSLNSNRIFNSRLTYEKGAALVHTLRFVLNDDELFFQGLRNFQNTYKNKTALGINVQEKLEEISGINLSNVFEEWYFGEGYPTYSAEWNYLNNHLHLVINQTSSMPNSIPFFTNPLELKLRRFNQTDSIIRVDITSQSSNFVISLDSITNILSIDPNNWIVNKSGSIVKDLSLNLSASILENTENTIFLHPNPSNDFVLINGKSNEKYDLTIINSKGKIVNNSSFVSNTKIDLRNYEKGYYQFHLVSNSGDNSIVKIVKID